MIDIENIIFNKIALAVRAKFPGVVIGNDYENTKASFPYVSIVEADNYTLKRHMDSGNREKVATVMYEVNVYSNRSGVKRTECREIMNFIDELMFGMNFTRVSMTHVPDLWNGTMYRLNARYEAETDGNNIFRR